ncbi:hypothetical protein A2230_02640 [candidate division WOR-1 bacterium RIFOXYA2_FULL_36_21]|uniref:Uncharacterized protein n=1 Tax=candidate division WOR-1 bacterium RIFOXYB2_FULL_36_35 TaxID=1802578 RepID=A0A1F4RZF8_UNCSA|nr:MAG: hypothetical protein A2230_02640 [candidate division WOR-1 bacterium RIFOXYA2_FULL_36_21]OGC12853.1 MAG: hypothetical protein A2290_02690 [candidate division WOR-1 bacterium RIFOXYB2_FULL_36_35]OGC19925.1 MAG: hypothetical protein A2282_02640 [candidate division WOR-1 bacterium RIFOXYA12_FULL_36_13]
MGISSESHGIKLLAWGIKKSPKIKQSVNSAAKVTAWVMANSPAKYIAQDLLKRSYNSYGWTERAEAWNKRGSLLTEDIEMRNNCWQRHLTMYKKSFDKAVDPSSGTDFLRFTSSERDYFYDHLLESNPLRHGGLFVFSWFATFAAIGIIINKLDIPLVNDKTLVFGTAVLPAYYFLLKPTVDFFITPRSLHFKIERFKSLMQTI